MKKSKNYHLMLKKLRLEKNITQCDLSKKLGESQSYVSKYENGEQRLDLYEIENICTALDIDLLHFIRKLIET